MHEYYILYASGCLSSVYSRPALHNCSDLRSWAPTELAGCVMVRTRWIGTPLYVKPRCNSTAAGCDVHKLFHLLSNTSTPTSLLSSPILYLGCIAVYANMRAMCPSTTVQ